MHAHSSRRGPEWAQLLCPALHKVCRVASLKHSPLVPLWCIRHPLMLTLLASDCATLQDARRHEQAATAAQAALAEGALPAAAALPALPMTAPCLLLPAAYLCLAVAATTPACVPALHSTVSFPLLACPAAHAKALAAKRGLNNPLEHPLVRAFRSRAG